MTSTDLPFDFERWLTEARIAQGTVEILQRPDLLADYQDWQRRYDRAQKLAQAAPDERTIGDGDPLAELKEEGRNLAAAIRAARTTWYLAALSFPDEEAIEQAHPIPDPPIRYARQLPSLPQNATETQSAAFLEAIKSWQIGRELFEAENASKLDPWREQVKQQVRHRQAERIVRSVMSIKDADGTVHKVKLTVDQVLRLERTIGSTQIDKLITEIDRLGSDSPTAPEADPAFLSRT